MDDAWATLKTSVGNVAKEELGTVIRRSPDWFQENEAEINALIEAKNQAYQATLGARVTRSVQNRLTEARRNLQRRLREIKDEWYYSKAVALQQYADAGNLRKFYMGLKELHGPETPLFTPVLSRDGVLHYETPKLRNNDIAINQEVMDGIQQLPIKVELDAPPRVAEVLKALHAMSDGKAPGPDGIPTEVWKYGGNAWQVYL